MSFYNSLFIHKSANPLEGRRKLTIMVIYHIIKIHKVPLWLYV